MFSQLRSAQSGFIFTPIVLLGTAFILLFFYLLLDIPVSWNNYRRRNTGKDMVGKYYVVQREQDLDENKHPHSNDVYHLYPQGSLDSERFEVGEVIAVQNAEYRNYFEGRSFTLGITKPCQESQPYRLRVNGNTFLEGNSFIETALEEIPAETVMTHCDQLPQVKTEMYKNLGQDMVGKYFYVRRLPYKEGSYGGELEHHSLSRDTQLQGGELFRVTNVEYDPTQERNKRLVFTLQLLCTQPKQVTLSLDPQLFKLGVSYLQNAVEALPTTDITSYCETYESAQQNLDFDREPTRSN